MVAYKIFKSGDNFEIYEYEYMSITDENPEKEEKEEEEEWDYPEDVDRKEERRKQTLRENAMHLKRMARENFKGKVFFLTLTFKENLQDIDKADRKLKYFFKKMRENYGDVKYIGVRERQERGAIHYHFIMSNEIIKDYYSSYVPPPKKVGRKTIISEEQKQYQDFMHKKYWKHGFVNLTMIDFVDDVGAYLAKYMSKSKIEEMAWLENRRLILKSEEIKKIEPLCEKKDSAVFQAIIKQLEDIKSIAKEDIKNNEKRKRVFSNGYKSKFRGQISYFDVHLSRIAEGNK